MDNAALLLVLLCSSYGKTKAEVEMVDVRADRIGGIPLACERKGEDDRACVHHREEEWQSRE